MQAKRIVSLPEPELLEALRQGNEDAFFVMYERYKERIYVNMIKIVRSERVAEELLQDVFLKVWDQRAAIDPLLSFQAYLFRISSNLAIDFYRRAAKQRMIEALSVTGPQAYDHVEQYIDFKEAEVLLGEAIGKLPPQRQRIFRLCRIEGKSYEEVADLLGVSRGTVQDHMVKANRFLREMLGKDLGFYLLFFAFTFSFGH